MPIKPVPPPKATIINNPLVQDLFIDEVAGLHRSNGNLRITLAALHADHSKNPAPIQRVVVGRLIMSLDTAALLQKDLTLFLERTKKQLAASAMTNTIQ